MMHDKVSKVFKAALKDELFLKEIKEADGDKKPGRLSDNVVKHLFGMCYYGWLVGKYGNDWDKDLNL